MVRLEDVVAGRIDPRVVGVLTKLSEHHKLSITGAITTGADANRLGRGVDIAAIDGETVGPGSPLARDLASELSQLEPDIRPNEIGSPFAIAGPGYFTDAAHQNHIHIGFKQAITPDWKPPADVAASTPAAAPVATAAAVTPAAPAAPRNQSQLFQKISATASTFRLVRRNPGATAWARSVNSRTEAYCPAVSASPAPGGGTGSGGTGNSCSPLSLSVLRLVTSIPRPVYGVRLAA